MLIAFEFMHYLEHKKDGREGVMSIKLDMSKAYDKVEWGFIKQAMEKMSFHEKWIELIMHCITFVSYSSLLIVLLMVVLLLQGVSIKETQFHLIYFCCAWLVFPPLLIMLP